MAFFIFAQCELNVVAYDIPSHSPMHNIIIQIIIESLMVGGRLEP